MSKQQTGL